MTIAHVLKEKGADVVSVAPETPMTEVARIIASRRIGAVVVLEPSGRLVGILSERDVVKCLAERGAAMLGLAAKDLMTRDVTMVAPETPVDLAMEIMDNGYFRHLPVCTHEGKLMGIISIRDLVKYRIMLHQHDVESLKAYITRMA
ncbi:CBS domain-containing protein [Roseomonas sp. CCTCC AB2023176]|uniref:CBS domain-containing protein n=1 Tax=Roseomonas sp. CCTCC AB2023176 TaxID=3342640 RepID=UPI0035DF4D91